jgi:gliding motility-associated transport system permease protein
MTKTLTLARRELASCFFSPMAYVIGAAVLLVTGVIFFFGFELIGIPRVFQAGNEASLRPLFDAMAYVMIFAAPLLTMRLLAGEFDSGTIETLMTAPVTDTQVVLGKFLGVFGFYVVLLAGSLVFLLVMALYGQPDPGVAVMGYVGMILLGAAFLSVGVFASTLTRHQIVAAILGVAILAVLAVLMQQLVAYGGQSVGRLASHLSVMKYFRDFSRGVFDSRGVVFFVTVSALFLFLSVKTLESRRWR